jgi:hypothetical protein
LDGRTLLSTFTVINANDSGPGSLRQALLDANSTPGLDTIAFAITGGVKTIQPTSALPTITDPVIIDATTQPGFSTTPIIELDGTEAGPNTNGLTIAAGNSTVRGLIITGFSQHGIELITAGNNVIEGNYIGTDGTVSPNLGNAQTGIRVSNTSGNRIGGGATATRNIISGNGDAGVRISGGGANYNVVQGNYIGTSAAGTAALGNARWGLIIDHGATGNVIGTNGDGINNLGKRNIIAASGWNNLSVQSANGNVIAGNYVGTAVNGTTALGGGGIWITGNSVNTRIGRNPADVDFANEGNVIAGNSNAGVSITGTAHGTSILGNSIYANSGLGIDLGGDGVTANTGTENPALPNSGMNFPVFTSATVSGTTLTVAGYVGTAPGQATFAGARVEIFQSDNDPSGQGQGRTYLGFLTSNALGIFSRSLTVSGLNAADNITGTATDAANNTSEFAANVKVLGLNSSKTTVVSSGTPAVYGLAVTFTATVSSVPSALGTPTGTVTFKDGVAILGSATLSRGKASFTTASLSAASHSITVSYSGDLLLAPSTSAPLPQTITPAPLRVMANNASKVYGQANPAFSASYRGFVNGDTPSALIGQLDLDTPATTTSPVNVYPITPSGLISRNYAITFGDGVLTIKPAPLTVTVDNASKVYGQPNPPFSLGYSGFVNGDTPKSLDGQLDIDTLAPTASPVGVYPIVVSGLASHNYTITYGKGTLSIAPASLTVTANDATKVDGQPNPTFSGSYSGLVNGDTPSSLGGNLVFHTPAISSSPVGTYVISPSGLTSSNYAIRFVNGTLTILAAAASAGASPSTPPVTCGCRWGTTRRPGKKAWDHPPRPRTSTPPWPGRIDSGEPSNSGSSLSTPPTPGTSCKSRSFP